MHAPKAKAIRSILEEFFIYYLRYVNLLTFSGEEEVAGCV